MKGGRLFQLKFDLLDSFRASVVYMDVDEDWVATDPRLPVNTGCKNDLLDAFTMREMELVHHEEWA